MTQAAGMASSRPRLCLVSSGGGHLRQILDLRPFWEKHDAFVVTEPSALAESLAGDLPVHHVPHFALGQARMHSLATLLRAGLSNMRASWRIVRTERPSMVVSTGAGSALFTVLFAKLFGARFVLIESFARFHAPSLFGRLARRFADKVVVQSKELLRHWPDAVLCDPLIILPPLDREKEDLGLVTVGTVLPFDRLVQAVAALEQGQGRPAHIIAQVGEKGIRPAGLEVREHVDFNEMHLILERANLVFCHGGSGSLITALRAGCRVVAMPRRLALDENYDDHQQEIVSTFAAHGLIQVAQEVEDLQSALDRALAAPPLRATTDPKKLIDFLDTVAAEWLLPSSGGGHAAERN